MSTQTVLITGATSGIGYQLAKVFARNGYRLVLVARNQENLEKVAGELGESVIQVISADLTLLDTPQTIAKTLEGVQIDILINNAGQAHHGKFFRSDMQKNLDMLHLNARAVMQMMYIFGEKMMFQKQGTIINIASLASLIPGPNIGVYAATKHFTYQLSRSVAYEWKDSGVHILTYCPGPTNVDPADLQESPNWIKRHLIPTPESVAIDCFESMKKKKNVVIGGKVFKLFYYVLCCFPMSLRYKVIQKMFQDTF